MNLVLHMGLLGSLEAAGIALLVGMLAYVLAALTFGRHGGEPGHVLGAACVAGVLVGAGVDLWKMFYLGMVKLESPLSARLALASIHDPDQLGTRAVLEALAALLGVGLSWWLFSARLEKRSDR